MTELRWEDPPATRAGGAGPVLFAAEAQAIKSAPGRWLVLTVRRSAAAAGALATKINKRSPSAYAVLHGAEACSRTVDGEHRVYVRWPEEKP